MRRFLCGLAAMLMAGMMIRSGGEAVFGQASISVTALNSSYRTVSGRPTGWFANGQDAAIMLCGIDFNNTGGPLLFNHPGGIASDGRRLLLADRNNNRVLIWNALPTGNTPPDLVLGQADFVGNNPGRSRNQLNWPVSVKTDGRRIVVADAYNDRLLIWNAFPTANGQPADLEIRGNDLRWPWGVWTDGQKLVASSTNGRATLIWNPFPTTDNAPPTITLRAQGKMGTPRTITSNGANLIVGDHNSLAAVAPSTGQGNFFWKTFPTTNDQPYDFFASDPVDANAAWLQGDFTADGRLAMLGRTLHLWNRFPADATEKPAFSIQGFNFEGGDGSDAIVVGNRLFLSLYNGNCILGYNSLPMSASQPPDFAIGSPDVATNTLAKNFMLNNPLPATDGQSLWVTSDFDRQMYVWKSLPDQSGAAPDFVYKFPQAMWDSELAGNRLALAGKNTVHIWTKLPRNGELPDLTFNNQIGNVQLQEIKGVAMDDRYFYLASEQANRIYVWAGLPTASASPAFTLTVNRPTRLSSDGQYLVVTGTESAPGGVVYLYRIADLGANSQPVQLGGQGPGGGVRFNLPGGALAARGSLFVADTVFSRVQGWRRIEDAYAGKAPDLLLGESTLNELTPEIGRNKLFWPSGLAFDGSHLWVGEFKFSHRLVRYTVQGATAAHVSAASFAGAELAADSIVSAFGTGLATATAAAGGLPLPSSLDGTTVTVTDSRGTARQASLFFVSPGQANYLLPAETATGPATIAVANREGATASGAVAIAPIAPGLFTANADGRGAAAAVALRIRADGTQSYETVAQFDAAQNRFMTRPIDLGPAGEQVFLLLYGTGLRKRSGLGAVETRIGGGVAETLYAGPAEGFAGLDQINVRLPRSLAGRGEVDLLLTVDGKTANTIRVNIR